MRNRFLLLLGLCLGSLVPAAAQTPAPRNVPAQEHVAPIITMPQTVSTPLAAASFLLSKSEKSNARRGRLQLDAFQSTLHIRDALLNPFDNGGMRGSHLPGQTYLGVPPSISLSGLSLGFHFGRNPQTGDPARSWRRLPRILGAVLN